MDGGAETEEKTTHILTGSEKSELDKAETERAEHLVSKMDPELLSMIDQDFIPMYESYAELKKSLHVGTNREGKRLSGIERTSITKHIQALEAKLSQRYTQGKPEALGILAGKLNLGRPHMAEALQRRLAKTRPQEVQNATPLVSQTKPVQE